MLAKFEYLAAVVMTVVALWRVPAVRYGDAHRRALWGGYAGFAAALWLSTGAVMAAVESIPVVDLDALLKHFASTSAIVAALTYVATSYGKTSARVVPRHVAISRLIARVAYKAGGVGVLLLTALFFTVVDRKTTSDDFVADHAGQLGAAIYMGVFYFFPLVTTAVCGYQWTKAARRAETSSMRIGLVLMAISMWMGLVYVAARITLIWVAVVAPLDPDILQNAVTATAVWMNVLFLIVAAGASIPTTKTAATRWRTWRTLYSLYPLWRELMDAFPGTSLYPPGSRLREFTRAPAPLDVRLDRWTQDIADACNKLRYFAPADLLFAAEEAASSHPEFQPTAEAYWIKAALLAAATRQPSPHPTGPLQTKPFIDTDSEAAWLVRVRGAYSAITTAQAQRLLEGAEEGLGAHGPTR
ncbi:MAB_1171c family putative transporter [Streptomyces sp. NPDC058686]|uniref:MAB_1171c family putative transporter n=1 Tax=Streptomyces sp. NPDC058686 TaxID=3346599 RepID=UPI00365AEF0B